MWPQPDHDDPLAFSEPTSSGAALADEPSWNDVERLADALEHAVGLQFRNSPMFPPGADQQRLAQLVARLDAEGYDAVWDWRRQWRLNEEFDRGNYTAYWSDISNSVQYDAVGPRVHCPIFRPTLQVLEARLNSTKPELVIASRSTDQSSMDKAKAGGRAVKALYQVMEVDAKRTEAVHKFMVKGTAIGKLTWNPKGGRYLGKTTIPMRDEITGEMVPLMAMDENPMSPTWGEPIHARNQEGVPQWEVERDPITGEAIEEDAWEGCPVLSVVDAENVLVDPTVTRWEDRMWAEHRYYEGCASIEDRLGFVGIHPDGREQAESPQFSFTQKPGRKSKQTNSKTALVRELYIRRGTFPCSDKDGDTIFFPDGWIIVECQGQVKAMPNKYGDGPLFFRKAMIGDEQLHGECIANDLRGLQATFTDGMSNWSLQNALNGNPRTFWPAGAGTPDEDKYATPGALIQVDSSSDRDRPYTLDGKSISQGSKEFVTFIYADLLGYTSGVREGGIGGGAPPGDPNAAAYQLLIESDNTRLATTVINYGLWLQDLAKATIHVIKTFASESRIYAYVGADMKVEAEEFAGSDVSEDFLYLIVPSSIKPQSDAARRAAAIQMFTMGILTRRDLAMRLGETEGEDATEEMRLIQQCKREARQALEEHVITTPLQLMQWEDHELAIGMHRADVFDQRFFDDPIAQAVLIQNMQIHGWFLTGMIPELFPGDPAMLIGFMPAIPPMQPAMPGQPGQEGPPGQGAMPPDPTQAGSPGAEPGAFLRIRPESQPMVQ